jgi:hypothetical protein
MKKHVNKIVKPAESHAGSAHAAEVAPEKALEKKEVQGEMALEKKKVQDLCMPRRWHDSWWGLDEEEWDEWDCSASTLAKDHNYKSWSTYDAQSSKWIQPSKQEPPNQRLVAAASCCR